MFVLHGHRLCRDIAVVLIASFRSGNLIFNCIVIVKLETGDSQDLKYGVFRIRGRGGRREEGEGGGADECLANACVSMRTQHAANQLDQRQCAGPSCGFLALHNSSYGSTILQWEEVTTPAPIPLPTPSPTPECAEATTSSTPTSPTCVFDVLSGGLWCDLLLHHQSKRSRWQLRYQTCVSLNVGC